MIVDSMISIAVSNMIVVGLRLSNMCNSAIYELRSHARRKLQGGELFPAFLVPVVHIYIYTYIHIWNVTHASLYFVRYIYIIYIYVCCVHIYIHTDDWLI